MSSNFVGSKVSIRSSSQAGSSFVDSKRPISRRIARSSRGHASPSAWAAASSASARARCTPPPRAGHGARPQRRQAVGARSRRRRRDGHRLPIRSLRRTRASQNWFSGPDMIHEATPLELRTQSLRRGLVLVAPPPSMPCCRLTRGGGVSHSTRPFVWGHELEELKNDRHCRRRDCASFPRVRGSVVAIPCRVSGSRCSDTRSSARSPRVLS